MSEKTVREILEIHGKNLVEHLNRKKYPDNFYKIDQAETEINALIESEKIRFAEECVKKTRNQYSGKEWSIINNHKRNILENISRAKGNKAVD